MNVLSLFDGMSCGQLALKGSGIAYDTYYASEIDKFAIKVAQHNFPNTIQLGDVRNVFAKDLPKIDLILAGSPCQGFSFAGKGLNFEDPRSKLFFEFVRILNEVREVNPRVKFLLENVKMAKGHEVVITDYCGVSPIEINSTLVSAQNRKRLYWSNIAEKVSGLFGDKVCSIPQPKDRGIFLKDITLPDEEVPKRFYISEKALARILRKSYSDAKINPEKTGTLNTKNNSGQLSVESGTTLIRVKENYLQGGDDSDSQGNRIYPDDKKAPPLGIGHAMQTPIICAMRGRNPGNPKSRKSGLPTEQMIELNESGKSNCLTSVQKDNLVLQLNPNTESGGKQPYQQNRIYDEEGKCPALLTEMSSGTHAILQRGRGFNDGGEINTGKSTTISSNSWEHNNFLIAGTVRRLTPIECCRLQTVPDEYFIMPDGTPIISKSQQYRCLGNGWTIKVIEHILSFY